MPSYRRVTATAGLLLAFGIAATIAVVPKFKADGPAIVVLIALLAGLWLAGRDAWGKPSRALWLVIAAGLLMLPAVVIARAFGRLDMLALLFHLNMGTEGAGLGAVKNQIIQACVSIIVIVLCYHCLASLWQWRTKAAVGLALALDRKSVV